MTTQRLKRSRRPRKRLKRRRNDSPRLTGSRPVPNTEPWLLTNADEDRRRQHPNPKRSQPNIHLSPPSELVPKWNKLPVNHCRTVEAALPKPLYSGTFDYPAAVSSLHGFSKNRRNRSACALPFCVDLMQHRLTDSTRLCHIPDLKWRVLYFF